MGKRISGVVAMKEDDSLHSITVHGRRFAFAFIS
jgi:hypothetical protein